jgi:hypothetical protein
MGKLVAREQKKFGIESMVDDATWRSTTTSCGSEDALTASKIDQIERVELKTTCDFYVLCGSLVSTIRNSLIPNQANVRYSRTL